MGSISEVPDEPDTTTPHYNHSEVTVVTAFFDLGKRERGRPRRLDQYLRLAQNLLGLKVNMFIMVDPHVSVPVWRTRQADPELAGKTFMYPFKLEDSPLYRHRPEVEQCYAQGGQPQGLSQQKDTPLYVLLGWTRYWILQQAAQLNPFNSKCLVWVDFGLFHLYQDRLEWARAELYKILGLYPRQKLKLMLLQDTHPDEIRNRKEYYSHRKCKMAAGLFGGDLGLMKWFSQEVRYEMAHCLATGHPSPDEALANVVYTNHKDKFETYIGDYRDLLFNFDRYQSNLYFVWHSLVHSRSRKLWSSMLNTCREVDQSIHSEPKPPFGPLPLMKFYDEYLLVAWFGTKNRLCDLSVSRKAADQLLTYMKEYHKVASKDELAHFNRNLSCHSLHFEVE